MLGSAAVGVMKVVFESCQLTLNAMRAGHNEAVGLAVRRSISTLSYGPESCGLLLHGHCYWLDWLDCAPLATVTAAFVLLVDHREPELHNWMSTLIVIILQHCNWSVPTWLGPMVYPQVTAVTHDQPIGCLVPPWTTPHALNR